MSEIVFYAISCMAGIGLGIAFYGGLWWTVRRSVVNAQWAPWILVSLVIRTLIVIGGFYWVSRGNLLRLLFCLLGFLIARILITRLVNSTVPEKGSQQREEQHAHHS